MNGIIPEVLPTLPIFSPIDLRFPQQLPIPPPRAASQTFSLHRSRIPLRLSLASFRKQDIGNPLVVPPYGGTTRGLPISCFLNEASDSLNGILDLWSENVWLAARGGGIGSYWGNLRSIGEKIGRVGKTSGIIPFIKVMDSLTMAISQGSLRRGSAACYIPIDHPEIEAVSYTHLRAHET